MAKRKPKQQPSARDLLNRSRILSSAHEAVTSARNEQYGEPQDDFACTSELWDSYIARLIQVRGYPNLQPHDVSAMMILLKISRIAQSPGDADHWIDIAGYSAIGAECTLEQGDCCS